MVVSFILFELHKFSFFKSLASDKIVKPSFLFLQIVNAECKVLNTLPVRTMVCVCIEGYQGNAAVQCDKGRISLSKNCRTNPKIKMQIK